MISGMVLNDFPFARGLFFSFLYISLRYFFVPAHPPMCNQVWGRTKLDFFTLHCANAGAPLFQAPPVTRRWANRKRCAGCADDLQLTQCPDRRLVLCDETK